MKAINASCLRLMTLGSLVLFFTTGCQTYEQKSRAIRAEWQQGNVAKAAEGFTAMTKKNEANKDTVVWRLEQGTALRAMGQFQESITAFEAAEERINQYDEQAKISVGREAGAILSNQAQLPYEGHAYDKILLNTYKALNYLQLGELEKARVEFIRAQQRQDEAVEINKARIEKAEAQLAEQKEKEKFDSDKVMEDPQFKTQFDGAYAFLDQYQAEANYKNPAAVYLHGLFFMATATGLADLEMAKHSFDEVTGMLGENKLILQDQETLKQLLSGQTMTSTTYVVFETGRAVIRDQIKIDLPLIIVGVTGLPYVGAAFPMPVPQLGHIPYLQVSDGDTTESTTLLASMDAIIVRDFANELPMILTKTMASALAKAAKSYFSGKAAKQAGGLVEIFVKGANLVYDASVNIADTRTWTTLPKEFQFCRIPTSADRTIQLSSPDGLLRKEVTVAEGGINLIYVKAINTTSPLIVSQVNLTPSAAVAVNGSTAKLAEKPTPRQTVPESVAASPPPPPRPTSETEEQRQSPASSASALTPTEVSRPAVPVTVSKPVKPVQVKAIVLPVKPKADRLSELDALYRSDRITSGEYHRRRAEIVAESK